MVVDGVEAALCAASLKAKTLQDVSHLSEMALRHVSVMSNAFKIIDVGQCVDAFFHEGPDYESGDVLTAGGSPAQAKWQTDVDEVPALCF